jgi:GNAT superfamily N-acetyltransferase
MNETYKPADLSDIELLLSMMKDYYEFDHLDFDKKAAEIALNDLINNDFFGRIYLINRDDITIGYIVLTLGYSLEFKGRDAFVDEFFIKSEYRKQGAGKRALKFIGEVALTLEIKALHLEVERNNTNAQIVYRKSGFEDHDRYLLTKWLNS